MGGMNVYEVFNLFSQALTCNRDEIYFTGQLEKWCSKFPNGIPKANTYNNFGDAVIMAGLAVVEADNFWDLLFKNWTDDIINKQSSKSQINL